MFTFLHFTFPEAVEKQEHRPAVTPSTTSATPKTQRRLPTKCHKGIPSRGQQSSHQPPCPPRFPVAILPQKPPPSGYHTHVHLLPHNPSSKASLQQTRNTLPCFHTHLQPFRVDSRLCAFKALTAALAAPAAVAASTHLCLAEAGGGARPRPRAAAPCPERALHLWLPAPNKGDFSSATAVCCKVAFSATLNAINVNMKCG